MGKLREAQQLFEEAGITGGAAYHRVNHLVNCGWYDGSIREMRKMLETRDKRLIQLEAGQRPLFKKLVSKRT